jgi:hypothetical protein
MRKIPVMLFAFCLAVIGQTQPNATWEVYGEKNFRPRLEPIEIEQGGQCHFKIASNSALTGSDVPLPYTKPLAQVSWSIQPSGRGASVSADGTVLVSPNASPGSYEIRAQAGHESRSLGFLVYSTRAAPLTGTWGEQAETSCKGAEMAPETPMRELVFRASGKFSATWTPFETRKDYWGTYDYDVTTGKLVLHVERSNYRLPDMLPEGIARIDNRGRLIIRDMWLGTPLGAASIGRPNAFCWYVFTR